MEGSIKRLLNMQNANYFSQSEVNQRIKNKKARKTKGSSRLSKLTLS